MPKQALRLIFIISPEYWKGRTKTGSETPSVGLLSIVDEEEEVAAIAAAPTPSPTPTPTHWRSD